MNVSSKELSKMRPFAHALEHRVLDALRILVEDDDGCAAAPIEKENIWNRQKSYVLNEKRETLPNASHIRTSNSIIFNLYG